MKTPIIVGNWKMNNGLSKSVEFVKEIKAMDLDSNVEKVIAAPYTSLSILNDLLKDTNIALAAQNMHWEEKGAFTGEISPTMLKELNVKYVILGHSERRSYFSETDEMINNKIKSAFAHDIIPILCCGETLEEREANIHFNKIKNQIFSALEDIDKNYVDKVIIAYEPIWAIGTGLVPSIKDIYDIVSFIRDELNSKYGNISNNIRIQYGGSVKPTNIREIIDATNIDGALVGGASLKASDFASLINYKII